MEDFIDNLRKKIDQTLLNGIDPKNNSLNEAMFYALSVKGKRLRPLLFLTLIEAFKKDSHPYLNIACSIEYIHTYSLIHDDLPIMDDDDLRRGMPTVHKKYNEALALLAGDTLLTLAFELISRAEIPDPKIVNILKIVTSSIGNNGMAGGQTLDLEFNGEKEKIMEIHRKKTAELIKGTFLSAAEIIGINEEKKRFLEAAGISIGIAFQLADDLLDVAGDEKIVGKRLKKDDLNESPNSVLFFGEQFVKDEIDRLYNDTIEHLKNIPVHYPPFLDLIHKMAYRAK
jgi:geranylgeranyl diphosphate synthase type II